MKETIGVPTACSTVPQLKSEEIPVGPIPQHSMATPCGW